jgi:hypothetical protein
MNNKEREIFYRLLIDLFLDHPDRRKQTDRPESKQKRKNNHESTPTDARKSE